MFQFIHTNVFGRTNNLLYYIVITFLIHLHFILHLIPYIFSTISNNIILNGFGFCESDSQFNTLVPP